MSATERSKFVGVVWLEDKLPDQTQISHTAGRTSHSLDCVDIYVTVSKTHAHAHIYTHSLVAVTRESGLFEVNT